jgi:putative two-component system response regulator
MTLQIGPILCVDDDPTNLGLMRTVLQDDYRLAFARSGAAALEACERHRPSLILLDVHMPDMDGLQVARAIKAHKDTENTPIIFVTSRSNVVDEEAGFEAGAVDYITKPISPSILRARVRSHLSLVRSTALEASYRAAIFMLGEAGHYNDNDTGHHIWRMAAYSRLLALAVGWTPEQANLLELAAPMHDMGKIGVPDSILKKPGPLTPEEWVIMRTHSTIGRDILAKGDAPVFRLAATIAHSHHERWDGSGYPCGLKGDAIPESARIVAVADVFDALTMKRPYKEPWPVERVINNLQQGMNQHLEARLVRAFINIMPSILQEKARWESTDISTLEDKALLESRDMTSLLEAA